MPPSTLLDAERLTGRRIVDRLGVAVGRVDDLELLLRPAGTEPVVTAVLSWPTGTPGWSRKRLRDLGIRRAAELATACCPIRIAVPLLDDLGEEIRLSAPAAELGAMDLRDVLRDWLIPDTILLSELLGADVVDDSGRRAGRVVDLRLSCRRSSRGGTSLLAVGLLTEPPARVPGRPPHEIPWTEVERVGADGTVHAHSADEPS
ncbi:MAG TPA: hypothetical protein VKG45_03335 [Actinomycetes bacterium]|nr:hypothetical protein [Actinomycetes bacterium]